MRWKTSALVIGSLTPVLSAPAPVAGQGRNFSDISDFRKAPGGTCALGDFYLPFEMAVARQ